MNQLSARIREILKEGRAAGPAAAGDRGWASAAALDVDRVAAGLGGQVLGTASGPCIVVDRAYHDGYRHGGASSPLEDVGAERDALGLLMGGDAARCVREATGARRLVFFDLETTGLGGGAGSRAFLVGCGAFVGRVFQTRQFFLPSPSFEPALLVEAGRMLLAADALVSFNGKSFDAPLLDMRLAFHRMETTLQDVPHLDLLHPARRLWRAPRVTNWTGSDGPGMHGGGSHPTERCTLGALEGMLLGVTRVGDPEGFEIPSIYFDYLRTGDPTGLDPVLEHNRLDLLSLAALTARAVRLVREGALGAATSGELLGVGRIFERAGRLDGAVACYERASEGGSQPAFAPRAPRSGRRERDGAVRAEALRRLARCLRRTRRFAAAAEAWQRLADLEPDDRVVRLETLEALAVHHEHRTRDLTKARQLALRAFDAGQEPARRRLEHRLARLARKLEREESPRRLLHDDLDPR